MGPSAARRAGVGHQATCMEGVHPRGAGRAGRKRMRGRSRERCRGSHLARRAAHAAVTRQLQHHLARIGASWIQHVVGLHGYPHRPGLLGRSTATTATRVSAILNRAS